MARKRLFWKTISIISNDDCGRIESSFGSSKGTVPARKTFTLTRGGGGCEIETNMPLSWLRDLFRFADVVFHSQEVVWDSVNLEERVAIWEAEDKQEYFPSPTAADE